MVESGSELNKYNNESQKNDAGGDSSLKINDVNLKVVEGASVFREDRI